MAHISSISFSSVDTNSGCTCDRCGLWIKNIWSVRYDDGLVLNYGMDCYDNLLKTNRLNKYGITLMHKTLKKIEKYSKEMEMWQTITYEEARAKGLTAPIDPDSSLNIWSTRESDKNYWCGRPFEEYKQWMLENCYPHRLDSCQKELDKFKKINFNER